MRPKLETQPIKIICGVDATPIQKKSIELVADEDKKTSGGSMVERRGHDLARA